MAKDPALVFANNCCCLLDWCAQKRINHILRDNVVQFVAKTDSDRTEYDSWKRSLGLLMVDDFDRTTRPRVRVGHFHPDNMIWKEDAGTGNLLFAGVQKGPTTLERGINKRTKAGQAPPRPTMTLHAMDDWFQIKRDESMPPSRLQTDYLAQYPPIKTKLAASAAEIVSAKQFRAKKPGRKTSAGRPFMSRSLELLTHCTVCWRRW